LGATYRGQTVGTFGDVATFSFYPAHHITTGEGGAVATNRPYLKKLLESFRDWGRDCWCATGCDNTCGRAFRIVRWGNFPPVTITNTHTATSVQPEGHRHASGHRVSQV